MKAKKINRVSGIINILTENPNQNFKLQTFCDMFGAAKSSISEDISAAKEIVASLETGQIETSQGFLGGAKYIPWISDKNVESLQKDLCNRLQDSGRIIGSGFIYTSDLMYDSHLIKGLATIFTRKFQKLEANIIATIETKGIPLAFMTAHLMNLPLVVIRREAKISEGSTVSINYFSGSYDRVQKMSIAKRAIPENAKAIVIDDFMRGGGSVKGIADILTEFDVEVLATGVVIESREPVKKVIENYVSVVYMGSYDDTGNKLSFFPNYQIF